MGTYLVTGGAGFIGSHLAETLVRRGDKVRILDNLSSGSLDNLKSVANDVEFIEGDLLDAELVERSLAGIECVFHHAALASVPLSVERPLDSHAACATGSLQLLVKAREAGVRRVVCASSSAVYGERPTASKSEADLPQTLSPYAAAKLSMEHYCQAFHHSTRLETVCLRYFNVFGPKQDPGSAYAAVIPIFISSIVRGQQPTIFGDGRQTRDFVYVQNVVDANLLASQVEGASGRVFNIGGGQSVTLLEMFGLLCELLNSAVTPLHADERPGDIRHSLADISMARRHLGFEPAIDLRAGLERSIEYYRQIL